MDYTRLKETLQQLKDEPIRFIEKYLSIETVSDKRLVGGNKYYKGNLCKLILNEEQRYIANTVYQKLKKMEPVRILILKPRQIGISTISTALGYHFARFNPNTTTYVVAHSDLSSKRLFNMVKIYQNELPNILKPMVKYSNKRELVFENPNPSDSRNYGLRSKIVIDVPNKDMGASFTISFLHMSEIARWNNTEEIISSISQTMPYEARTIWIIESTAQGFNDYFHNLWLSAKRGEVSFLPIFFSWKNFIAYQMPLDEKWYSTKLNSKEIFGDEIQLKKVHNLSDRQLYWRRWCIINNCNSNPSIFQREYPLTDTEPFISVVSAIYDSYKLQEWFKNAPEGTIGDINENRFKPCRDGLWTIWEKPEDGVNYIAGLDTATGLEKGDYSVCEIFRADTLDQVAELRVKLSPTEFARISLEGIKFYNRAFANPEITGCGIGTLGYLKENYDNIYLWERFDEYSKTYSERKLGFETNTRTRNLMINVDIKDYINDSWGKLRSKILLDELMTFVRFPDGSIGTPYGCHDDTIFAFGLVLRAYKSDQRDWRIKNKLGKPIQDIKYEDGKIFIPYFPESRVTNNISTPWGYF